MKKKKLKRVYIFRSSKLKNKGNFRYLLSNIFGIGFSKSFYLCDILGFGKSIRIEQISLYRFHLIIYLIRNFYVTDLFLKKYIYDTVKFIMDINTYKGFRIMFALPCNGQRTKSNSSTCKRARSYNIVDKFSLGNFVKKIKY